MRKLKVSDITANIAMPVKGGTWTHIQNAYTEAVAEAVRGLIGRGYATNRVYILSGCENSGSGSNYTISAGSVFFNGEVYTVPAASFSLSGPNVAVGVITKTQYTGQEADPVTFTDGQPYNIMDIFNIVVQPGLSGSGAGGVGGDFLSWRMAKPDLGTDEIRMYFPVSGDLSDFTGGVGVRGNARGWLLCDGGNGTPDLRGRFAVSYRNGDVDFGNIGGLGGSKTKLLTTSNIPAHRHHIFYENGSSVQGNTVNADQTPVVRQGSGAGTGNNNYEYQINGIDGAIQANVGLTSTVGSSDPDDFNVLNPYFTMVYVKRAY